MRYLFVLAILVAFSLSCSQSGSDSSSTASQFEVRGKVTDLVDQVQKSVSILLEGEELGVSDENGTFSISIVEGEHTLTFQRTGYTTAYSLVYVGDELPEDSEATLLVPTDVTTTDGTVEVSGTLSIVLKPTQNLSLDGEESITLSKSGSSISTQEVFNFQNEKVFTRIKSKSGTSVRRNKYEGASLDFSKIDPTRELNAMPGPLSAQDSTFSSKARFKGRSAAEGDEVGLSSVTMMDLTLRDADGEAIQMEDGDVLESFVRLPERDQENYLEDYENGERVIPWYSFDVSLNTWIREGEAELVNINDEMYAKADVTHFSWWNLDKPIKRGQLNGKVFDNSGNVISGCEVVLEAIGDSYRTKTLTNSAGEYSFKILRNSKAKVYAVRDGVSGGSVTLDFDDSPETSPHEQDLTFELVHISGQVLSSNDQPLADALIKLPSGQGVYSDSNGQYEIEAAKGGEFDVYTQITQNSLNFISKSSFSSDNLQDDFAFDIIIDTENIIQMSGLVSQDGVGVPNASVYTLNGERTTADTDGVYTLNVSKTAGVTSEDFQISIRAFYFDETTSSFPELSYDIAVAENATEIVQNFAFSTADKVELIGKVLVDGVATQGIEIFCDNGCITTTDSDGLYSFEGYIDQTVTITAITTDLSNESIKLEQSFTFFETTSEINQAEDFEFVLPQAVVEGTVTVDLGDGGSQALGGVRIVSAGGSQRETATNGGYSFVVAPEAATTLWFEVDTPSGLVSIEKDIEVLETNEVLELDVVFSRDDILNISPIFESVEVSSFQVEPGDNVQITVNANDPDAEANQLLSFTAVSQDEGLGSVLAEGSVSVSGVTNTQVFTFTAGTQTGWVETELSINDGENTITRPVNIEIVANIVNEPPSLLSLKAPTKVQSHGTYEIVYLTHDPEGNNLTYSFDITPVGGFVLNHNSRSKRDFSGQETLVKPENQRTLIMTGATVGTVYTLSANVSDGSQSLITTQEFVVVDEAPVFKNFTPNLETLPYSDDAINFTTLAEDPEGTNLTYEWLIKVDDQDFESVSNKDSFSFIPSDYLEASDNVQKVTFLIKADDNTNISEKQHVIFILPQGREVTKTPIGISVSWDSDNHIDIGSSISYTASLIYNTGEQEDITANVTPSGFGESSITTSLGTLTAVDDGNFNINFTYTSNGLSFEKSLFLSINPPVLSTLIAMLSKATVVVGDTIQVFLSAIFDSEEEVDVTEDENSKYFSNETGIASFDEDNPGQLTAHNVGSATLSFSYTDPSDQTVAQASQLLEVQPVELESFSVTPQHLDLEVGESYTLVGNAIYNNGSSQLVTSFKSSSENPDVAIVNEDSIVFPVGAGNTEFTHLYSENGIEKTTTTTISVTLPTPEIISLRVVPEDVELFLNKSQDFHIYALYNTGVLEEVENASMTMSANLGDFVNGTFTGNTIGSTTFTFSYEGLEAESELSLVPEPDEATFNQISKIGGAAYKVESLQRTIGDDEVDLIVYSDYRTVSSVLVNDPSSPVRLAELEMPSLILDFELTENYLHVAMGYKGYAMVTYDNPSSLEIPKGYERQIDGWVKKVITQKVGTGRFAYLISEQGWSFNGRSGIDGLVILDITNPRNIVQVGKVKVDGNVTDLTFSDNKLYLSHKRSYQFDFSNFSWSYGGTRGVSVIDVEDPNQATLLETHDLSRDVYSIHAESDRLLVGCDYELREYDISKILGGLTQSISLSGYVREIQPDVEGYILSLGFGGVGRVERNDGDLSLVYRENTPTPSFQPEFTTLDEDENDVQPSSSTRSSVYSATSLNGTIYLANGFNGLGIFEEESDGLGKAEQGFPNLGYTSKIQVSSNVLFSASWENGVIVLNVEDPDNPSLLGSYNESGYYVSELYWNETEEVLFAHLYSYSSYWWWCYYGGSLGTDPHKVVALKWDGQEFTVQDSVVTEGWVNDLSYSQGKLFMIANDFGYYQWGYNNSLQSISWNGTSFEDDLKRVEFSDDYYYTYLRGLASNDELVVVGSYYGTYLYNHDLERVSQLTGATENTYRYPNSYSFMENGDLIINGYARLHYIDLSDITTPERLSVISTGWGRALDSESHIAMTGNYWGGLTLVSFRDPSNPVLIPQSDFTSPRYLQHLEWDGDRVYLGSGWNGVYVLESKIPDQYTNRSPEIILESDYFIVESSDSITLDASQSTDTEGDDLSYEWSVINSSDNSALSFSAENASVTELHNSGTALPIYVQLVVSDLYSSTESFVTIIENSAPTVFAGNNQRFVSGENIFLSGSYYDVDSNVESVLWNQVLGESVTLSDNQTLSTSFIDSIGTVYGFDLIVSDGFTTVTDYVEFERNTPPIVQIEGLSVTGYGDNVIFSSNTLIDGDGDELSLTWTYNTDFTGVVTSVTGNSFSIITPQATGNISVYLTAWDGYESYEVEHLLTMTGDNFAPVVTPIEDIILGHDENVLIQAFATDQNSDELSYVWKVLSGNSISFQSNVTSLANITSSDNSGITTIQLDVSDNSVIQSIDFDVIVNEAPEIEISTYVEFLHTDTISIAPVLTDYEYDELEIQWTQTLGENVSFVDNISNLVVEALQVSDYLEFEMSVSDAYNTTTETISVNVIENNAPVISSISGNSMIYTSSEVTLESLVSDDENDALTYSWSLIIDNAEVQLSSNTSTNLIYTPTEGGVFVFELEVSDYYQSQKSVVELTVNIAAPNAISSNVYFYSYDEEVTLSAESSYDEDSPVLFYSWTQLTGDNITLTGESSESVSFTPGENNNQLQFELEVSDGYYSDTSIIEVNYRDDAQRLLYLEALTSESDFGLHFDSGNLNRYFQTTSTGGTGNFELGSRSISFLNGSYLEETSILASDNYMYLQESPGLVNSIVPLEYDSDLFMVVADDYPYFAVYRGLDSGYIQMLYSTLDDYSDGVDFDSGSDLDYYEFNGNLYFTNGNTVFLSDVNFEYGVSSVYSFSGDGAELSYDNVFDRMRFTYYTEDNIESNYFSSGTFNTDRIFPISLTGNAIDFSVFENEGVVASSGNTSLKIAVLSDLGEIELIDLYDFNIPSMIVDISDNIQNASEVELFGNGNILVASVKSLDNYATYTNVIFATEDHEFKRVDTLDFTRGDQIINAGELFLLELDTINNFTYSDNLFISYSFESGSFWNSESFKDATLLMGYDSLGNSILFKNAILRPLPIIEDREETFSVSSNVQLTIDMVPSEIPVSSQFSLDGDQMETGHHGEISLYQTSGESVNLYLEYPSLDGNSVDLEFFTPNTPQTLIFETIATSHGLIAEGNLIIHITE